MFFVGFENICGKDGNEKCLPAILVFASININMASATIYDPQDCYSFTIESLLDSPVSDPKGPYTGTEGVPIAYDGRGS
jgi:hypothetical protein